METKKFIRAIYLAFTIELEFLHFKQDERHRNKCEFVGLISSAGPPSHEFMTWFQLNLFVLELIIRVYKFHLSFYFELLKFIVRWRLLWHFILRYWRMLKLDTSFKTYASIVRNMNIFPDFAGIRQIINWTIFVLFFWSFFSFHESNLWVSI